MHRICSIALLAAVVALGCGQEAAKVNKYPAVTGVVTLDGNPLADATVSFLPTSTGDRGVGVTDSAGKYALKGIRGGEGVPAGDYKVTVSRFLTPDGKAPPPNTPPANTGARESIPVTYSDANRTTLKATVGASGGNFDFAVKSK